MNVTVVPTTAGLGETTGLDNDPTAPAAEPTMMTRSNKANPDAATIRLRSSAIRRTMTPVISGRMGREGAPGNGTAVMVPRDLRSGHL